MKAEDYKELEFMLSDLPENRPLYKDSGLWQIRSDDMEDILYWQGVNESFFEFIKRVHDKDSVLKNIQKQ